MTKALEYRTGTSGARYCAQTTNNILSSSNKSNNGGCLYCTEVRVINLNHGSSETHGTGSFVIIALQATAATLLAD